MCMRVIDVMMVGFDSLSLFPDRKVGGKSSSSLQPFQALPEIHFLHRSEVILFCQCLYNSGRCRIGEQTPSSNGEQVVGTIYFQGNIQAFRKKSITRIELLLCGGFQSLSCPLLICFSGASLLPSSPFARPFWPHRVSFCVHLYADLTSRPYRKPLGGSNIRENDSIMIQIYN